MNTLFPSVPDAAVKIKFRLQRVRLNSGGHDTSGCYFGTGQPLFRAQADEEIPHCYGYDRSPEATFRADSREHAKDLIRREFPLAYFYT